MAIAACMAYVDLNPIRAGLAATPETSDFTSVKERIADRGAAMDESAMAVETANTPPSSGLTATFSPDLGGEGCLPMTLDQYLSLFDGTGRQLRKDKVDSISAGFAPIFERLDCSAESWLDLVRNFRKRFRTEAGLAKSVLSFRAGRQSRRQSSPV